MSDLFFHKGIGFFFLRLVVPLAVVPAFLLLLLALFPFSVVLVVFDVFVFVLFVAGLFAAGLFFHFVGFVRFVGVLFPRRLRFVFVVRLLSDATDRYLTWGHDHLLDRFFFLLGLFLFRFV